MALYSLHVKPELSYVLPGFLSQMAAPVLIIPFKSWSNFFTKQFAVNFGHLYWYKIQSKIVAHDFGSFYWPVSFSGGNISLSF